MVPLPKRRVIGVLVLTAVASVAGSDAGWATAATSAAPPLRREDAARPPDPARAPRGTTLPSDAPDTDEAVLGPDRPVGPGTSYVFGAEEAASNERLGPWADRLPSEVAALLLHLRGERETAVMQVGDDGLRLEPLGLVPEKHTDLAGVRDGSYDFELLRVAF